jgi:hypothetical protein
MAAAMLRVWESQGRPWRLATPLVDMVDRLKAAHPQLVYGTLGDDSHLNAVPPEDHTPFSATGYPKASPYPVVHALDVMHHPESGVDAGKLFAYWLAEAKAGRMPWLKYLIWQAKIYDVRFGWRPQSSSGHFDHVHLSSRTDAENTHLGAWSPVPEDDMALSDVDAQALIYRVHAMVNDLPAVVGGPTTGEENKLHTHLTAIDKALATPAVAVDAAAVAAALAGNTAFLDALAKAVVDEEHSRLAD